VLLRREARPCLGHESHRTRQRHRGIASQPGLRLWDRVDQAVTRSRRSGQPSSILDMPINSQIMLVNGVLARTVSDVRLGLGVVMGAHHRDPQSIDVPLPARQYQARGAGARALRGETDAAIAEGVRIAGAHSSGRLQVEEIEPPMVFESYLAWTELI